MQLAVNTIKMLAVDAVEKANSGHPGMPMGAADMAFVLWNRFLHYSAHDPKWPNRDRFVLSAGHGSMLLYALLHLSGFDLSLDDLKHFRQWGSRTPGHPEFGHTAGVETTTGPLGQGFANAVGMAIAAKMMAARFNRDDFSPIDHYVYAILGDGDVMEGITSEAASIAGHLGLGNIVFLYDDNRITIDGKTEITFSEDVARRFEALGWHTQKIDGHDHEAIASAIENARAERNRPSLICARTHIGHGAPKKQDTAQAHGAPLGKEEVAATKKALGWPLEPTFLIPEEVKRLFAQRTAEAETERKSWEGNFLRWRERHPDLSRLWDSLSKREVPKDLTSRLLAALPPMPDATRSISSELEQIVAELVPSLAGGAADLEESTKTNIKASTSIKAEDFSGRNLHFGIREHAMGAIANGMALYGSWIPFTSTFFIFSDYMRPAIRLAAMCKLQVLYLFTHDSFFVGEDGPTHQPIEQLGSMRLIPNFALVRPADALECAAAWEIALSRKEGPTALCLTRQKLPAIERNSTVSITDVLRGGYIACEAKGGKPDVVLIGTGSELHLAVGAKKELEASGIATRVVSIPCLELFASQPESYRSRVIPPTINTAVVEAGRGDLWYKWIGREGLVLGIDRFGASAPAEVLAEKFGFSVSTVAKRVREWLGR